MTKTEARMVLESAARIKDILGAIPRDLLEDERQALTHDLAPAVAEAARLIAIVGTEL